MSDRLPSLLSIIDMCDIFGLSLSEFFEEDAIDRQTNLEKRILMNVRQLTPESNEKLLALLEQLVAEKK